MFRRQFLFLPSLLAARNDGARPIWTGPGVTALGTPSPDGKLLSCIDPATRNLAVREIETGKMRVLTRMPPGSSEFAYFSAISPRATHVAFAWNNKERFYDLRVVPMQGGEPRILYSNPESGFVQPCSWSPDGKQILTLFFRKDNTSQIALVSAADGSVRVLRSLSWVYPKRMDFSPDGRFIVYDTFAGASQGPRDIFLLAADGSSETRVVEHPADDLYPLWTKDGKHVVFASDRDSSIGIYAVTPAAAGAPVLLRANAGAILPLGLTNSGELFYSLRTGSAGARIESLTAPRETVTLAGALSPPEWSPDGAHLAYLARKGPENFGQESRTIRIRSMDSKSERELPARLAHIERVRWSPDSTRLLVSGSDGKGRTGLFTVQVSSGATRPVLTGEPDAFRGVEGAWIGDTHVAAALKNVERVHLESGERTPFCDSAHPPRHLVSSGALLAFQDGVDVVVLREGQALFRQTRPELQALAWAGGKLILAERGRFLRIDPDTRKVEEIAMGEYRSGPVSAVPGFAAFLTDRTAAEIWTSGPLFPEP